MFLFAYNNGVRLKPAELIPEEINIPVGSQIGDTEPVGQRLDDIETALADRTCGTQNGDVGDAFHTSPRLQSRYANGACISS